LILQQEALAVQDIPKVPGEVRAKANGLGFAILDEWLMMRRGSRSRQAGRADAKLILSDASGPPMLPMLDRDGEQLVTMLHLHADAEQMQQMLAGKIGPLMLELPAIYKEEEEEPEITILPSGEGRKTSSSRLQVLSRAGGALSGGARAAGFFLSGGARSAGGLLKAGAIGAVSKTVGVVASLAGRQPPPPESSVPASAAERAAVAELHQPPRPESPAASGVGLDAWAEELLEDGGDECLEMFGIAKLTYEDDVASQLGFRKIESEAAPAGTAGAAVAAVSVNPTASLKALVRSREPVPSRCSEANFGVVVELAFRGSANLGNWLADLTCSLATCRLLGGSGKVHSGFQDSYLVLKDALLAYIRQDILRLGVTDARVLLKVTGHSLGGALAMLAAYELSQLLSTDASVMACEARVVTFGSPRLGDREFKECYTRVVRRTANFVNKFDPVPWLPGDLEESFSKASNDAEAMSAIFATLLRRPLDKLGAVGFCSFADRVNWSLGPMLWQVLLRTGPHLARWPSERLLANIRCLQHSRM